MNQIAPKGFEPGDIATDFRAGMRQLAAGISLITTQSHNGPIGMIATSVCSVSLEPPTLLVCINHGASGYQAFDDNAAIGINLLGTEHSDMVTQFTDKERRVERFSSGHWSVAPGGAPMLDDALAGFDCHVVRKLDHGTHTIFIAIAQRVRSSDARTPLVHYDRGLRALE